MNTHVNLVDLTTRSGTVEIFQSVKDLSEYTIENGKFFPKDNAYAGSLLHHLLCRIFNPEGTGRGGSGNRRRNRRGAGSESGGASGRKTGYRAMPY